MGATTTVIVFLAAGLVAWFVARRVADVLRAKGVAKHWVALWYLVAPAIGFGLGSLAGHPGWMDSLVGAAGGATGHMLPDILKRAIGAVVGRRRSDPLREPRDEP